MATTANTRWTAWLVAALIAAAPAVMIVADASAGTARAPHTAGVTADGTPAPSGTPSDGSSPDNTVWG